jgi:ABC-type multidrug transport system fused ATPase/permease subunit
MLQAFRAATSAYGRLFRLLGFSRLRLVLALFCMLAGGAFEAAVVGMLVPLLSILTGGESAAAGFIHRVLPFLARLDRGEQVLTLSAAILLLVVLKNVMGYSGTALGGRLRAVALVELRRQIMARVLHAPPAVLEKHTSGEVASALLAEVARVNRALDYLVALVQRAIMAFSYLMAVLLLSWELTLAAAAVGGLLGFTSLSFSRRALRLGRDLSSANKELGRQISETTGGLRVIRATATEHVQKEAFSRWNQQHATAELDAQLAQSMLTGTMETLGVVGAMAVTALAYQVWLAPGTMDVSRFLAFAFGLIRMLPAWNQVYGMQGAVTGLAGSVEKCLVWLDVPSYPTRPFGDKHLSDLKEGVTFDSVSFSYPDGHVALKDVSFELRAGETVAVLGPSGSGKSTLASLLVRLLELGEGRILFDGLDHWEFEPRSFHRAVALVEQDPFLFNTSIADNLSYGMVDVSRDAMLRALDQVDLSAFIERLPNGIDTVVGERGATLSGGQRQRLAIARAILRNPRILVLDEPTSALDAATEHEVVLAITAASVGRTTLIITHRPTTIAHAGRVLSIAGGRLLSIEERRPEKPLGLAERSA